MRLLDPLFSSDAVSAIFSEDRRLQAMLDFESALAAAESREQVIPPAASDVIASCCRAELFDRQELAAGAAKAGNLAIPLVKALTALVREKDDRAAGYVHWGATSQDAIDTGLVLQLRDAIALIEELLDASCAALATLTERYRETPMAGRTWLQHAVPVTFGLKTASSLDAMLRHKERLAELTPRVLVLQFGGAAGTLASLGSRGMGVSAALAEQLRLELPDVSWHSHRDRVAEMATFCGLLVGTLGKIGRDVALEVQTEVDELMASAGEGRGGSSTMPHKRNPVAAAVLVAAAVRVPGLVGTMLSAMVQEHERGLGGWHAEWEVLPQIVRLTAGALEKANEMWSEIEVHSVKMRTNLEIANGMVMAEAVSMALAEKIGREEAHRLVEAGARRATEQGRDLRVVVEEDSAVMDHLDKDQMERLFDPLEYMGSTQAMIDRVLLGYRRKFEEVKR